MLLTFEYGCCQVNIILEKKPGNIILEKKPRGCIRAGGLFIRINT